MLNTLSEQEVSSPFWKIAAISLVMILLTVVVVGGLMFTSASSNTLNVSLNGPHKLGVNEPGTYTATVDNANGALRYDWSIYPETKISLTPNGETCTLVFTEATEEPYVLSVQAVDANGNFGSTALTVYDPYASSSLYLSSTNSPYKYKVESDGSGWYRAVDGVTGQELCQSTNASYVYNTAAGNLSHTYQQTILISGPAWTITNPLLVYSYETLQIDTTLTLGNGANCNMIQNANPSTYNIYTLICGSGILNGNNAGNTAGNGIYFEQSTTIPSLTNWVKVRDLEIVDFDENCIRFDADGNTQASYFWFENLLLEFGDETGMYISNAYDVHINNCHIGSNLVGLKLVNVSSFYLDHAYINQGVDITSCTYGAFTNFRVDIGIARNGINLNATQLFTFTGGNINTYGSMGSGKAAISLGSYSGTHSRSNCFSDITLSLWTGQFSYGVVEGSSSQDYNTYTNINGQYCTNYGIKTLGSNSHGAAVWNASTYVADF